MKAQKHEHKKLETRNSGLGTQNTRAANKNAEQKCSEVG